MTDIMEEMNMRSAERRGKIMKKVLACALVGVMTLGLLAGCSSGGGEGSGDDGGKKTLDVVWFSDGGEGESFMKLAEEYMAEHEDIEIELIEVPYADLDNKLKNMINAGEQPALARMTNIGTFQNQLLDLKEYVSDPEAFEDSFGTGLQFIYDGKMIAAPMDVTANGIIYNKTAFEQAGVEVPQSADDIWTWDEFAEALQTVVDNSDCQYGMVFDKSAQRFSTLIYEAGGSLLNEDLTESNFNTDEVKRATEWFKEMHDNGLIPTSVWLGSENPNEMFRTGQVAAHFAGSWMIANYKEQITDFEWGVTYLPQDAQRSSVPGGKWLGAFQGSGVEQEAADFIEWIMSAENNAQYCMENYYLSQVKGNESLDYDFGAEYFAIFADELNATSEVPGAEWGYQALVNSVQTNIVDGVASVLAGDTSVDDFTAEIDGLITESLADLNS